MDLSAVPEVLVTVRAAGDKMQDKSEGKGEPAVSFSGRGKGKCRKPSSAKHLQDMLAARKAKSTCHECGHWAGDLGCTGLRDTNFTAWSDEQMLADREDYRAITMVERIEQFGVFPSCSGVRERSVCTTSVTNLQHVPVGAHAPVMANDHSNHVLVVTGTGLPAFSAESREIGRSVMENSEHSESKSDVGLGMIDTACLC